MGVFGKQNYSEVDQAKWVLRTNQKHRDDVEITLTCSLKSAQNHKESDLGCRYSSHPILPQCECLQLTPRTTYTCMVTAKKGLITNERISLSKVPPEVQLGHLPACMGHSSSLTAEQWMQLLFIVLSASNKFLHKIWSAGGTLFLLSDFIANTE